MPMMNAEHEKFKGDPEYELDGVELALGEVRTAVQKLKAEGERVREALVYLWNERVNTLGQKVQDVVSETCNRKVDAALRTSSAESAEDKVEGLRHEIKDAIRELQYIVTDEADPAEVAARLIENLETTLEESKE